MKKAILVLVLAISVFSCQKDDESCADIKADLNAGYDRQAEWGMENISPIDYAQIALVNEERENRLGGLWLNRQKPRIGHVKREKGKDHNSEFVTLNSESI